MGDHTMNHNVEISVVIPAYNVETWIKECIDSVINQRDCLYEIICINDGSTDGTLNILKNYESIHNNIKVYTTPNRGLSAARNFGMNKARGKYIYFVDSDDCLKNNDVLKTVYNEMEKYKLDIFYFDAEVFTDESFENENIMKRFNYAQSILHRDKSYGYFASGYELFKQLFENHAMLSCAYLQCIRSEFLKKHKFIFPEGIIHEDLPFYYVTLLTAEKVKHSNLQLYRYRVRHGSITSQIASFEMFYGRYYCWKEMLKFAGTQNYTHDQMSIIGRFIKRLHCAAYNEYKKLSHSEKQKIAKYPPFVQYEINDFLSSTRHDFSGQTYIFPWHLFKRGDNVVLYGGGRVGMNFFNQIVQYGYLNCVGIVDKNADEIWSDAVHVMHPSKLNNIKYDYILISVLDESVASEIKRQLVLMGIDAKKILWDGFIYKEVDFFRGFYFPLLSKTCDIARERKIAMENDVVGYGLADDGDRQIILVGAGNIGMNALKYFKKYRVKYFADNDPKKIGTKIGGVPIISVDMLNDYKNNYDIVISMACPESVFYQLNILGINRYYTYKDASIYEFEKFISENKANKYHHIALYGTGSDAMRLYSTINRSALLYTEYIVDNDSSDMIGKKWNDHTVYQLNDVKEAIDCIIIGSGRYHMAIEARIRKLLGDSVAILDPFKLESYNKKNILVINNYLNKAHEAMTEAAYIDRETQRTLHFDAINEYVAEVESMSQLPLFAHVEIETVNRCNGTCQFCPVNKNIDSRPLSKMSDNLFEKIICELEDLNYTGRIAPFSNNEPFIDLQIIERTAFIRQHLPNARIHLFTNGTLLTLDKYLEIMKYLDELIIDNYNQDLELNDPVKSIYQYCMEHPEMIKKTDIVLRKPNEILTTRGGDAPNRHKKISYPNVRCSLPYRQIIIRPTGEISLCCNDPLGKCTLGDVSKERLIDIWYGERFNKIRNALLQGRGNFEHCKYCDTCLLN